MTFIWSQLLQVQPGQLLSGRYLVLINPPPGFGIPPSSAQPIPSGWMATATEKSLPAEPTHPILWRHLEVNPSASFASLRSMTSPYPARPQVYVTTLALISKPRNSPVPWTTPQHQYAKALKAILARYRRRTDRDRLG